MASKAAPYAIKQVRTLGIGRMNVKSYVLMTFVAVVVIAVTWLDMKYFENAPVIESRHDAGQALTAAKDDGYLR